MLGCAWLEAGEAERALREFSSLHAYEPADVLDRRIAEANAMLQAPRANSRYVPRQFAFEVDRSGTLDAGQILTAKSHQRFREFGPSVVPAYRLHDSAYFFSEFLVRHSNDRNICYERMGYQQIFSFLGIDVYATRNNHEGFAVGKVEKPVVIKTSYIPERRPIRMGRVASAGSLFRVVMVLELVLALEIYSAFLSIRYFITLVITNVYWPQKRTSYGSRMSEPITATDVAEAVSLRTRVILMQNLAPPLDHLPLYFYRARCGSVDRRAHRRDIIFGPHLGRQLQHAHEHGRHPLTDIRFVLFYGRQSGFGVEMFHDDNGSSNTVHTHAITQRRCMIERRRRQIDRIFTGAEERYDQSKKRTWRIDCLSRQGMTYPFGSSGGA